MEINCDFGESYGRFSFGDDLGIAPHVHAANIACGFHGGDPSTMAATVRLAAESGLAIGAHPSLPDLAGFGRREMRLGRRELRDAFIYQIGALKGFVEAEGLALRHLKPHGIIYTMAGTDRETAETIVDAAEIFGLQVYGMTGTAIEVAARDRGLPFIREFFADLACRADGSLIVDKSRPVDLDWIMRRSRRALDCGNILADDGSPVAVAFDSIYIHNEMPNAAAMAAALRRVVDDFVSGRI